MLQRSAWTIGLIALVGAACSREPSTAGLDPCTEIALSPASAPPASHNVIVIVNDTMRRDRMGAYGGPAETPAFDAFAAKNLLFEHAFTQAPWTKPSIATLFTSLYPSQHGVASDPQFRNPRDMQRRAPLIEADVLSSDLETLPEVMRAAGLPHGRVHRQSLDGEALRLRPGVRGLRRLVRAVGRARRRWSAAPRSTG